MAEISVIIPVYNVEKYLPTCLESVINQTFSNIEIICVNDGSPDNCAEILKAYAQKDHRIKIITQENQGLSMARNNGLAASTADYVVFIDSDDFVDVHFLEILYSAITSHQCDIAGCSFAFIDQNNHLPLLKKSKVKVYTKPLRALLRRKNFIYFNVWNKIYKRSALKDVRFVEGLYFEDWVFNVCVFAQALSFAWVNNKLYGYRLSNNSIMRSRFTLKKLEDYVKGIQIVATFYQKNYPHLWPQIKKTRISKTVKEVMKYTIKTNDKLLCEKACISLKDLMKRQLIGYSGLSFINKVKLFKFLNWRI